MNSVIRARSLKWGDGCPAYSTQNWEVSRNRIEKVQVRDQLSASWLVVGTCSLEGS